jgi:hypothetical protein
MGQRIAIVLAEGEGQMGHAGRSRNGKPRPAMEFVVQDVSKFVIAHRAILRIL